MSPKKSQKDICTHVLREISNSFATGLLEDPVYIYIRAALLNKILSDEVFLLI